MKTLDMSTRLTLLLLTSLIYLSCGGESNPKDRAVAEAKYPPTQMKDAVDTLHGTVITDPYRWLEDGESEQVIKWTIAQNYYTRDVLNAIPIRDQLQFELKEAMMIGDVSAPRIYGSRYFYTKRSETQDQAVLYMKIGRNGDPVVLIDPNAMSAHAIVSLDWFFPSHDGKLVAYGLSSGGDEQSTLAVLNTDDLKHTSDTIPRTSAASLAWLPDNSGFYYTRYPTKGEVPEGEEVYHRHVFLHMLGEDPADDNKIFGDGFDMQDWTDVLLSESGRYLIVYVFKGWSKSELYLRDLSTDRGFVPLAKGVEAHFRPSFLGDDLYVRTNLNASNFRVLKADFGGDDVTSWKEIVPEQENSMLESFGVAADRLVLSYLHNVSSQLKLYDPRDNSTAEIELPGIGSVSQTYGEIHGREIFFDYESFFVPTTIFARDVTSGEIAVYDSVEAEANPELFTTKFVKYRSKDSTEISMFLVHKKDLKLDGTNPTLLTGYGGFSHSETPYFSATRLIWLNSGGVYALPHLRGGAEYGEEWHKGGMLDKKQNTFDDFIAAAEYLIEQSYTSNSKLAIWGGSNGGLLVGAVETQRPDLFKVVICSNPLLDMVRYHQFLIARLWIPEYGSADDPDQFDFIYAYSPYHHVVDGTAYPATLVLTSDSDSRVDPLHARKMVARLQAANASEHPQLLRFEFEAGHGQGMPMWKRTEQYTDIYSFIFWQLGMKLAE
ncbi:MAG: prolyl oligopeptidase family serine peptidase [Candidatus Zixiibacteriota bacterium]